MKTWEKVLGGFLVVAAYLLLNKSYPTATNGLCLGIGLWFVASGIILMVRSPEKQTKKEYFKEILIMIIGGIFLAMAIPH